MAVSVNGDGPLVGREPSARRSNRYRSTPINMTEVTKNHDRREPIRPGEPDGSRLRRWAYRARDEVALHVLRGASTAAGAAMVTGIGYWLASRR